MSSSYIAFIMGDNKTYLRRYEIKLLFFNSILMPIHSIAKQKMLEPVKLENLKTNE